MSEHHSGIERTPIIPMIDQFEVGQGVENNKLLEGLDRLFDAPKGPKNLVKAFSRKPKGK